MGSLTHKPGLPQPRKRIFGRKSEATAIAELLDRGDSRIVTLTGPGGVGKTSLASQVAARFAWDAIFVRLETVHDPDMVLSVVAARVGVRDGGDVPLLDHLAIVLEQQQVLLVLDNLEQVPECGASIGELVDRCPHLKVLITSRSRLRIQGEQIYRVLPLEVDESPTSPAVQLFIDRVRSSGYPAYVPARGDLEQIAALCRRLDRLPLAIELAAARVPALSLSGLVDRLDALLPLLTDGPRDAPERLQSLDKAIAWSYDLLSESQRRMFRCLSVFEDGWSIESLMAVCSKDLELGAHLVAELASLVDQNLVIVTSDANGKHRYRMLDSVREFAVNKLEQAGGTQAVKSMHAHAFHQMAVAAGSQIMTGNGADYRQVIQWFDREHRNVRADFDWFVSQGMGEQAIATAAWTSPYNYVRGNLREDRDCLATALALPSESGTESRAFALVRMAIIYWGIGGGDRSYLYARRSYHLAESIGCEWVKAIAVSCMAEKATALGNYEEAIELGQQAIALFRKTGPVYELCWALNACGTRCRSGRELSIEPGAPG